MSPALRNDFLSGNLKGQSRDFLSTVYKKRPPEKGGLFGAQVSFPQVSDTRGKVKVYLQIGKQVIPSKSFGT